MTLVTPQPASNALTITAASTPTGLPWTTTLTTVSSLSPWAPGQNGYMVAPNTQFTGGFLVTAVGSGTITVQAATVSAAAGGAPLKPTPTTAWAGTGTMVGAGPLTFQQI